MHLDIGDFTHGRRVFMPVLILVFLANSLCCYIVSTLCWQKLFTKTPSPLILAWQIVHSGKSFHRISASSLTNCAYSAQRLFEADVTSKYTYCLNDLFHYLLYNSHLCQVQIAWCYIVSSNEATDKILCCIALGLMKIFSTSHFIVRVDNQGSL